MTVTTSFASKVFTSSVPNITLVTDYTRVHVIITIDTEEIYNEYLYPDSEGNIEILDMPGMVSLHVRQKLVATLTVEIQEENVTEVNGNEQVENRDYLKMTTELIYCAALVDVEAETFCYNNFLSLLQGKKITSLGRLEYLHYIGTEEAIVAAFYDDNSSVNLTPLRSVETTSTRLLTFRHQTF